MEFVQKGLLLQYRVESAVSTAAAVLRSFAPERPRETPRQNDRKQTAARRNGMRQHAFGEREPSLSGNSAAASGWNLGEKTSGYAEEKGTDAPGSRRSSADDAA